MSKKVYANRGSFWSVFVECSNGSFKVGSGEYTDPKGKKHKVALFFTLPKKAPEDLQDLAEEFFEKLGRFSRKHRKWCEKKEKKLMPTFNFSPAKFKDSDD